jgi:hypothetical protein
LEEIVSQFTQLSGVDARLAHKRAKTPEVIAHRYTEKEEQTIARLALTTVLPNVAECREDYLVREIVKVLSDIKDPLFVLKAMAVSRKANFKLFPKVAAAALIAQRESIQDWNIYEHQLVQMLGTLPPNQLLELVLIIKSKLFRKGLGSYEQRLIGSVMASWKPERLEDFTLSNAGDLQRLMRLVHPNLDKASSFVLDGRPPVTIRQHALKALTSDANPAKLIREHNLPFNYTKGVFSNENTAAWEAIAENMSPLQTLINLRALHEKGVMDPSKLAVALQKAENSRLLPIDILRPVCAAPAEYTEDLMNLLSRMAPVALPGLEDKNIAVLLDGSGSMTWTTMTGVNRGTTEAGKPTNWHRGITMAAPLLALPRRHFMIFDYNQHIEGQSKQISQTYWDHPFTGTPFLKNCPKEAILHNLLNSLPAGGTSTGDAVQWYTRNNMVVDVMFIITDEQQNGSLSTIQAFRTYQAKVNPNAKLVIINCTNTSWHMAGEDQKDVKIIQTVTPLIYTMFENYMQSTVDLIRDWKL